jgi:multiple sugar transport system permease protein
LSTSTALATTVVVPDAARPRAKKKPQLNAASPQWRFTIAVVLICAVLLVPVGVTVVLSVRPQIQSTSHAWLTWQNFSYIFSQTQALLWLRNSLAVTLSVVVVSVAVAAPAGYVLSRSRSKAVSGYALLLFVAQALPVIVSAIPLFVLFAKLNLDDSLIGVAIIYVSTTMAVAIWMMAAYFDTIPIALEEAAWIDGASIFAGFIRIVLRNSLPGLLSAAIFAYLLAWSDFLVAVVFLRSDSHFTLPIGLETFFSSNETLWGYVMAVSVVVMVPPTIIFSLLHRYFSIGGVGGALAGR